MDKSKFSISQRERYFLISSVIIASTVMILIVVIQYSRYNLFGTTLLLGWDSPGYVWLARYVINRGSIHMVTLWNYPHLYVQLLAFLGYLTRDVLMVERILPLTIGISLVGINSRLILKATEDVYIACLTAFLTALSVNVLRLLSDLNRNLLAFSLSFATFLYISNLDERSLVKKYMLLIPLLFVIAGTHFETYFLLALSLLLYGALSRKLKTSLAFILITAIPVVTLVSIFPTYFFGYTSTVVIFRRILSFDDIIMWTGGLFVLLVVSIFGSYLFYRSRSRFDKSATLIFSWCFVLFVIVVLFGPLNREFALRALYVMPTPLVFGLAVSGYKDYLKNCRSKWAISWPKKTPFIKLKVSHLFLSLIVAAILAGSAYTVIQNRDVFLTPFVSHSSYEKVVRAKEYLVDRNLSVPIVIFRGDPPVKQVGLFRNYFGAEIGEHFAYYGDIPNLFRLVPSQPRINSTKDPYLSKLERYYITYYYNELVGNISGPRPFLYCHDSYVRNRTLTSYPIVIVTPDFYTEEIPGYIKPFLIGDGIYVIPPNSIDRSEIT